MDLLPFELKYEVMYHLDISDIDVLDQVYNNISNSAIFWENYLNTRNIPSSKINIKNHYKNVYNKTLFKRRKVFSLCYETEYKFKSLVEIINIPPDVIDVTKMCEIYNEIININNDAFGVHFKIRTDGTIIFYITNVIYELSDTSDYGFLPTSEIERLGSLLNKYLDLFHNPIIIKYNIDLKVEYIILDQRVLNEASLNKLSYYYDLMRR